MLCIEPGIVETRAKRLATANFSRNRASGLIAAAIDLEWTFGRDGSLTARDAEGRWIRGCSLPRRTAVTQLRKLEASGAVACFLAPEHASAIKVALQQLRPEQAVIAIVPDEARYQFMLHCEDFSRDREAHRIYFVVGARWSGQLAELFDRIPGLSIPSQFIRVSQGNLDSIITDAQRVFSEVTARRAQQIQVLCARPRQARSSQRLCIVGASQRRLWNDWGAILADAVCDDDCVRVDPNDPCASSPLAVARAACECDAIVTADLSRADVPGTVCDEIPFITWVTNGKIPALANCAARDRLLLLDENDLPIALRTGWSESALRIAKPQAPVTLPIDPRESCSDPPFIAIVADTFVLKPPANIDEFSSHRLLWEFIADELLHNPFAIADDTDQYLTSRLRKLKISEPALNRSNFITSLIVPAYQQGILRQLRAANVPVKAFGKNWNTIEDRSELARALASSVALLHVFPNQHRVHAIDFTARAAIRPGRTMAELIRRCRDALAKPQSVASSSGNIICAPMIRALIAAD